MRELIQEMTSFLKCKIYIAAVGLVAACSYGFTITHYAIGKDDTAISLYFEDGVAPLSGRWCLFVINKILHIHIGDFAPWMVELVSVLIFILSVTLWCVLWKRVCEPGVVLPLWNYLFAAGIFISCPLISEVFIYYLHNGICTGYGVTALALLCLLESLSLKNNRIQSVKCILGASLLLTVAIGFYESFVIVYIIGGVMTFFLLRLLYGKAGADTKYGLKVFTWIRNGFLTGVISILLRSIILAVLKAAYHLQRLENYNVQYRNIFADTFKPEEGLTMNIKRFYMMYYVHAFVYFPITILVIAIILIGIFSLYYGIRKKDIMLPLCSIAIVLCPLFMSILESIIAGVPTQYRSSQYVPLVGAFAMLLLLIGLKQKKIAKWLSVCCYLVFSVIIFDQCADMNRWFYLDYLKYRDTAEVMDNVAYDLKAGYDISKPIVFRGAYRVPYSISEDAYCDFASPQYRWICRFTDPIDPHLKEKYFAENGRGYVFTEMPIASTLQWGITAFDGTAGQLIEFWNMHGHSSFRCETDPALMEEAEQIRTKEGMPGYPTEGYIKECENYIIVNLDSY